MRRRRSRRRPRLPSASATAVSTSCVRPDERAQHARRVDGVARLAEDRRRRARPRCRRRAPGAAARPRRCIRCAPTERLRARDALDVMQRRFAVVRDPRRRRDARPGASRRRRTSKSTPSWRSSSWRRGLREARYDGRRRRSSFAMIRMTGEQARSRDRAARRAARARVRAAASAPTARRRRRRRA